MPHSADGIVIEMRAEAIERDVHDLKRELSACAGKLDNTQRTVDELRGELDGMRDELREHLGLTRQIITEQRAARQARKVCVDRALVAATEAIRLLLGDPWVRRGLVVAILLLAASLAGFGLVQYNGDGLTIGQADPETLNRAASESEPQPLP